MIQGRVNDCREAEVRLRVRAGDGVDWEVLAVIDTGFSGYLTLPPELVTELDLPFVNRRLFALADDQTHEFDAFGTIVLWDGEARSIISLSSRGPATIGMALLYGCRVQMELTSGGAVTIETR